MDAGEDVKVDGECRIPPEVNIVDDMCRQALKHGRDGPTHDVRSPRPSEFAEVLGMSMTCHHSLPYQIDPLPGSPRDVYLLRGKHMELFGLVTTKVLVHFKRSLS
jgi:hypothetical protein